MSVLSNKSTADQQVHTPTVPIATSIEVHRGRMGALEWKDGCFWKLSVEPNYQSTREDSEEFASAIRVFAKGRRAPLLLCRGAGSSPTLPALTTFSKISTELLTAIAYVVPTEDGVKTASLIRSLFLQELPVEIFTNEREATCWIKDEIVQTD